MLVWRPLIWLSYYPDARIRASSLRLLYVPASFVFHNKQNQHHNASREYSPMKEPDHVFVSLLFHVAIERLYDVSNVVVQTALALVPRSFVLGNLDRNRVGLSFAAICMERVRTNKRGSKQVWSDYETHHVGIGYAKPWDMDESAWTTSCSRLVSWNVWFGIPKCNDAVSRLLWTIEPWHSINFECELCLHTVFGIAEAAPKLYVSSADTWYCSSFARIGES